MDEDLLKKIKLYIGRQTVAAEDEEALLNEGKEKLKSVLNSGKGLYSEDEYNSRCDEITRFVNEGEIQERKLYDFCLTFKDPFSQEDIKETGGADVVLHRFLDEDEFMQVADFVGAHKKDKTVGMIINQLMYDHKLDPPQVYGTAMISRQDFSRIVNNKDKGVSKSKLWSVIIGLRCNLDEADLVLYSAGYMRKNTATDLIIEYFIKQRNYDILAINDVLDFFKLKLLSVHTEVRDRDSGPGKKRK